MGDSRYADELLAQLQLMYEQQLFCDATLQSSDHICFHVHRVILASTSEVLKLKLAEGNRQEASQHILLNVPGEIMALLIHCMYTGALHIHTSNIWDLLSTALDLKMPRVISLCQEYVTHMASLSREDDVAQMKTEDQSSIHYKQSSGSNDIWRPHLAVGDNSGVIYTPELLSNQALTCSHIANNTAPTGLDSVGGIPDLGPSVFDSPVKEMRLSQLDCVTNVDKVWHTGSLISVNCVANVQKHTEKDIYLGTIQPTQPQMYSEYNNTNGMPYRQEPETFDYVLAQDSTKNNFEVDQSIIEDKFQSKLNFSQTDPNHTAVNEVFYRTQYKRLQSNPITTVYICKVCNKVFQYHCLLQSHTRKDHSITSGIFMANRLRHYRNLRKVYSSANDQCLPHSKPLSFGLDQILGHKSKTTTGVENSVARFHCCTTAFASYTQFRLHMLLTHREKVCKEYRKRRKLRFLAKVYLNPSAKKNKVGKKNRKRALQLANNMCPAKSLSVKRKYNNRKGTEIMGNVTTAPSQTEDLVLHKHSYSSLQSVTQTERQKTDGVEAVADKMKTNGKLEMHSKSLYGLKDFDINSAKCNKVHLPATHCKSVVQNVVQVKHEIEEKNEGAVIYECSECGKILKTQKTLEVHVKVQHKNIKPFICERCGKTYGNASDLRAHLKRHGKDKDFQCHMCQYSAYDKANLKSHLFNIHEVKLDENMRVFSCELCEFSTDVVYRYKDHMRVHENRRDIHCEHCNKAFCTKKALRSHFVKVHKPKSLQCGWCGYATADPSKLREHVRTQHTHKHVRPFCCGYCTFTCTSRENCRKHVMQKHPQQPVQVIKADDYELGQPDRNHDCSVTASETLSKQNKTVSLLHKKQSVAAKISMPGTLTPGLNYVFKTQNFRVSEFPSALKQNCKKPTTGSHVTNAGLESRAGSVLLNSSGQEAKVIMHDSNDGQIHALTAIPLFYSPVESTTVLNSEHSVHDVNVGNNSYSE